VARSALWLQCRDLTRQPGMRLFCFPHAGGGASAFHSWHAGFAPLIQVCPILLPGRERRLSEPLYTSFDPLLEALSEELRPWLDVPFAVFGHSMGALLAFEWVRKLQREGPNVPSRVFLSGRRAPDALDESDLLSPLSDAEFVDELAHRYQGLPDEFLSEPELMAVMLPILRADISVVESYHFTEGEQLNCPTMVSAGIDDATVAFDQLVGWQRHVNANLDVQIFPGGHFYPEGPLISAISAALANSDTEAEPNRGG
jgi:medium-chain acyl-[acyl-carrier-protein] hydrolase